MIGEDDVHVLRFTRDKQKVIHRRIEGWLVRHRLEQQHYKMKKQRDIDGKIKGELIHPVVEFLFLVNNDNDWNRLKQFKRLMRVWSNIWNEDCIGSIPDRDIGLFIKRVVYMNKVLSDKEANSVNIKKFNTEVLSHILSYKFKASNKELFDILKLPMSKEMDKIKIQFYDGYVSEAKNMSLGFFMAFLEMNIPSSYMNYNIKNFEFVRKVVEDFQQTGIEPDRLMTFLLIKVYGMLYKLDHSEETKMKLDSLIDTMFEKFTLTNDLINCTISSALQTENVEMLKLSVKMYKDVFLSTFETPLSPPSMANSEFESLEDTRFQVRLIDTMLKEARELGVDLPVETTGIVHQLELNTSGYYMVKYHLQRKDVFISLSEEERTEILDIIYSLSPLIEAHNTERLLAKYGDSGVFSPIEDESKMSLDERFEAGDFGAVAVSREERHS